MVSTKYVAEKKSIIPVKLENYNRKIEQNTLGVRPIRLKVIKMIKMENGERISSGYRKVDYEEQNLKEIYKKINKMLGGN